MLPVGSPITGILVLVGMHVFLVDGFAYPFQPEVLYLSEFV